MGSIFASRAAKTSRRLVWFFFLSRFDLVIISWLAFIKRTSPEALCMVTLCHARLIKGALKHRQLYFYTRSQMEILNMYTFRTQQDWGIVLTWSENRTLMVKLGFYALGGTACHNSGAQRCSSLTAAVSLTACVISEELWEHTPETGESNPPLLSRCQITSPASGTLAFLSFHFLALFAEEADVIYRRRGLLIVRLVPLGTGAEICIWKHKEVKKKRKKNRAPLTELWMKECRSPNPPV